MLHSSVTVHRPLRRDIPAMVGQGVEAAQLLVDARGQGEGIQALAQPRQLGELGRVGLRARLQARKRRLRRAILATESTAHACFLHEFDRREPEVLPQAQVGIQRVEGLERRARVIAVIAHQLAHVRPVLLFDVRVVVLLVRPPARELNLLRLAVPIQRLIDEFAPVIRVDAAQAEGQRPAQGVQRLPDGELPLLITARVSTHLVWMSITFSECRHAPSARSPACETRSISVKPGL